MPVRFGSVLLFLCDFLSSSTSKHEPLCRELSLFLSMQRVGNTFQIRRKTEKSKQFVILLALTFVSFGPA